MTQKYPCPSCGKLWIEQTRCSCGTLVDLTSVTAEWAQIKAKARGNGAEMLEPGYSKMTHVHRVTLVREKAFVMNTVNEKGEHAQEILGTIRSPDDWQVLIVGGTEELTGEAYTYLADYILDLDYLQELEEHANQDMQQCVWCLEIMRKLTDEPFFWEVPEGKDGSDGPICASCYSAQEILKQDNKVSGIDKD